MIYGKKELRNRYRELVSRIIELDIAYSEGSPRVSDAVYDEMYKELKCIEKENPDIVVKNSPTRCLDHYKDKIHEPIDHIYPMKSIENAYSKEDVDRFYNRLKENGSSDLSVEYKLDGVALSIRYNKGEFVSMSTRGDGVTGENVSHLRLCINKIPEKISCMEEIEVYGEVLIYEKDFEEINLKRNKEGLKPWANSRNLVSGSLRVHDLNIVKNRRLNLICYSVNGLKMLLSQSDVMDFLYKNNFIVNDRVGLASNTQDLFKVIEKARKERDNLEFSIDGVVIKSENIAIRKKIGSSHKFNKWQIAYKFPPETSETIVKEIYFQVGATGRITPVALIHPVKVGGVLVSHVTLHNFSEISSMDIRIGDIVEVSRGGDVIPKIDRILYDKRFGDLKKFKLIDKCPGCSHDLIVKNNGRYVVCGNLDKCPEVLSHLIKRFASKEFMNIEYFGDKTIDKLIDAGLIKNVADIFKINEEDLSSIDGSGEVINKKILSSINESRNRPLYKVLAGLGIRGFGIVASKKLCDHFGNSIEAIENATIDEIKRVFGIGDILADCLHNFFRVEKNTEILQELKREGVLNHIHTKHNKSIVSEVTVAVTGKFDSFSRSEVADEIERLGFRFSSKVGSKCNYLLCGEKPGKSKISEAKKLGVLFIELDDLYQI